MVVRLRRIDANISAFRNRCAAVRDLWKAMGENEESILTSLLGFFALAALMSFGAYLAMGVDHAIAVFSHVLILGGH
jgi:hypothetical protein